VETHGEDHQKIEKFLNRGPVFVGHCLVKIHGSSPSGENHMSKKIKFYDLKVIHVVDWDNLVTKTYGRPYCYQQQEGCRDRGIYRFTVPRTDFDFDYNRDTVPEVVNHENWGVSFAAWLKRDPKAPLAGEKDGPDLGEWQLKLWWHRNFFPHVQMVANDLHAKGILDPGIYAIEVDW
jgi:hypothetical protein